MSINIDTFTRAVGDPPIDFSSEIAGPLMASLDGTPKGPEPEMTQDLML